MKTFRNRLISRRRTSLRRQHRSFHLHAGEALEARSLLAIDSFHNTALPCDTNNDGLVTPLDTLLIINDLNLHGPHAVGQTQSGTSLLGLNLSTPSNTASPLYLDVNQDGLISPLDALLVTNALNVPGPSIKAELVALDAQGNVISTSGSTNTLTVNNGTDFLVALRVQDLRSVSDGNFFGVFSAFTDVTYTNPSFVFLGSQVQHNTDYLNGISGTVTPGLIDEAGGFAGSTPLDKNNHLVWEVPVHALTSGSVTFTPNFSQGDGHDEFLLFSESTGIKTADQLLFRSLQITINPTAPPLLPSLSISGSGTGAVGVNVARNEGALGDTTDFVYQITLSANPTSAVGVVVATDTLGTATSGVDYTPLLQTLTFLPGGSLTQKVTVSVSGDTTQESDETFNIKIFNPVNASLGTAAGTGLIINDDNALNVVNIVGPAPQVEGAALVSTPFIFTVSLTSPATQVITVPYTTVDGTVVGQSATTAGTTSTGGADYVGNSGTLTFAIGQSSATITVLVNGDAVTEADEQFSVQLLSGGTGATLGVAPIANATILNDDAAPTLTITGPFPTNEGNSGTTDFVFTLSLSNRSSQLVSGTAVPITAVGNTATSGVDYQATTATFAIPVGGLFTTVTVKVNGDVSFEADETFSLSVNSVVGAMSPVAPASATIVNDDVVPTVSIQAPVATSVLESDTGTKAVVLNAVLSAASAFPVTAVVNSQNGTATAGSDFQAITNQTITFAAGQTIAPITVNVIGDTVLENDETMTVTLSNPTGGTLGANTVGTLTLLNDDAVARVSIASVSDTEGNSGTKDFVFTVTLSNAPGALLLIPYSTADDTATAGSDYVATSGTLTFGALETTKNITVTVFGDTMSESTEQFRLNLGTLPAGFAYLNNSATGTIVDDDGPTTVTIHNTSITEGNAGTQDLVFEINLSRPLDHAVSVGYSTQDTFGSDSATAGVDYTPVSDRITFAANVVQQFITVKVIGDTLPEPNENFVTTLGSPSEASLTLANNQAQGTILDDDRPGVSIFNSSVLEGAQGNTTRAVFQVKLSQAFTNVVTMNFATIDGTATTLGNDYQSIAGSLVFAIGETSKSITVNVIGDNAIEADETFTVKLTNVVGAPINVDTATGKIFNDDPAAAKSVRVRLVATDTFGTPITGIDVGQDFQLRAFVTDLRTANPQGVFSAYFDVFNNNPTAILTPTATDLQFSAVYPNFHTANFSQPDLFVGIGAGSDGSVLGGTEQPFFVLTLHATSSGRIDFTSLPSTGTFETTLLGSDSPVDPAAIDFGTVSLQIGTNFFTIDNVLKNEGNSGLTPYVFTVTRNFATSTQATVEARLKDFTATVASGDMQQRITVDGVDFASGSATLTFASGVLTKLVTAYVNGDLLNEADETFGITLANASGASGSNQTAIGTIVNDDAAPNATINDVSTTEGGNLVFTVSLSAASGQAIPFFYQSQNFGATAGSDYVATSGTLNFAPGQSTGTITVATLPDLLDEPSEQLLVNISSPIANITKSAGVGTILNARPLQISGSVYVDANSDGIRQSNESGIAGVSVKAFNHASGVLAASTTTDANGGYAFVLAPGTYDVAETQPGFYVDGVETVGNYDNSGISSPVTGVQVVNDRFNSVVLTTLPALNFNFGEKGIRPEFLLSVINRRALLSTTIENFSLAGLSIDPVNDPHFNPTLGTQYVSFDSGWDGTRGFAMSFDSDRGNATLQILDNNLKVVAQSSASDPLAPVFFTPTAGKNYFLAISGTNPDVVVRMRETITIDDVTVNEPVVPTVGTVSPNNAVFTVRLSNTLSTPVTAKYSTANNTASSNNTVLTTGSGTSTTSVTLSPDYTLSTGTLTIAAGATSATLTVPVLGDNIDEADESFFVNLFSASNVYIYRKQAVGTIYDSNPAAALSVSNVNVVEGNSGTTNMVFTVTLSSLSTRTVTAQYKTVDNLAVAGLDYVATSGTLTFAPGELSKTVTVAVNGDTRYEPNDTFYLKLLNPVNAVLSGTGQGIGTIVNDDADPNALLVPNDLVLSGETDWLF